MATPKTCTVDKGGTGDYLTLNAANAAYYKATGADYVSNDECAICTLICTNGAADTTAVDITGMTTDTSGHNITLQVDPSYKHAGFYPTSGNVYRLEATSDVLINRQVGTVIDGLAISDDESNAGNSWAISTISAATTIKNCILRSTVNGGTKYRIGIRLYTHSGTSYILNNIIHDFNGTAPSVGIWSGGTCSGTVYIYDNTVCDSDQGINRAVTGFTWVAKGNLLYNNTADFAGTFDSTSTNNIGAVASNLAFGVTRTTGTTTSATAGKLNDTSKNFTMLGVRVGSIVKNTTDTTYTYVTAVDSATVLSVANDIFAASENYTIYYNLCGVPTFQNAASNNFQLLASTSNIAYQNGVDLSGDSYYQVTTDIDGHIRNATTPCLGADEVVVYVATATSTIGDITASGTCKYRRLVTATSTLGNIIAAAVAHTSGTMTRRATATSTTGNITGSASCKFRRSVTATSTLNHVVPAAIVMKTNTSILATTLVDAFAAYVATGSGTACLKFEKSDDSALITCNMSATPFVTNSTNVITANAISNGTASGSGTIEHLSLYNKNGDKAVEFTCGLSNAEVILPSLSVSNGDLIGITGFTFTVPVGHSG